MDEPVKRERVREVVRSIVVSLAMTIVTLAVLEVVLRVADFRELREGITERSLGYRYDTELGWAPIPNSSSVVTNARTIHAQHNSLGLARHRVHPRCGADDHVPGGLVCLGPRCRSR